MRILTKVHILLQLVVENQFVLLLGSFERVQPDGLEVGISHRLPGLADLPHKLVVCRRRRRICLPPDCLFELAVCKWLLFIILFGNSNDRLLGFFGTVDEVLTEDGSFGD